MLSCSTRAPRVALPFDVPPPVPRLPLAAIDLHTPRRPRMHKPPVRRARGLLLAFLLVTLARPGQAEEAAASEERLAWAGTLPAVEVEVQAPAGLTDCPDSETSAQRTNAYVGWDFARAAPPKASDTTAPGARVRLVFETKAAERRVDVRLFQPEDTAPGGVSLRVHEGEESCDELGRMAALTVSLLAKSPAPAPAVAVAVGATGAPPTPEPAPTPETAASEPAGSEPAAAEPAAPAAAAPATSQASPAEPEAAPPFEVGGSVLGGYGFVPGWSAGGGLFGAFRSGRFSVRLAGSLQAGPGETVPSSDAVYSGFGGTGDVSGCYAFFPESHLCVLGGVLWLAAAGSDFDENRQGVGTTPLFGLGLAQRFAAGRHFEWGVRLEGAVPLAPVELLLEDAGGTQVRLWRMPPVIVRLGLELAFR